MGPTNNIGYLLQHLSAVMAKQNDYVLQQRLGIGYSQFKILRVLQHDPDIQQRQIAEWLGQTEASISRQIRLMVDTGLLRVKVRRENRREHITSPTVKGMRMVEEAIALLNVGHNDMFERLGEKRQQQLLDALAEMHKNTCQPGRVGACSHPFSV